MVLGRFQMLDRGPMVLLVLLLGRIPVPVGLQCRKNGRVRLGLVMLHIFGSVLVQSSSSSDRELAEESSSSGGCGSMVVLYSPKKVKWMREI